MAILSATQQLFTQLQQLLLGLQKEQYTAKIALMSGASIGQHMRHIIELYVELQKGYQTGVVNYENRERDYLIETDKEVAFKQLDCILQQLNQPNKSLMLNAGFEIDNDNEITIDTNYFRELVYNIEHTVHHMALLRIAVHELTNYTLPENFGVAISTIKHRVKCAQ